MADAMYDSTDDSMDDSMDDQPPVQEISSKRFAPSSPCRKRWSIRDDPIDEAPLVASDLLQGNYPQYQAIDGPVEIDNLPPRHAHLEDFQVLGLLELRKRGGISANLLQSNWPLVFTTEGLIHWYRRPFGRPGVLKGEDGKWYIAMVARTYLLVGGGDLRAQFEPDRAHPNRGRVQMKDVPWISTDSAENPNENENPTPRQLLVPSCIELDLTTVEWPTSIDITRMPGPMRSAILVNATDGVSDGFVDAGKAVCQLISQGWDRKDPFQLPAPETYIRVEVTFDLSINPVLYSPALFDGRLDILRADQRAKEAAAERRRERLAERRGMSFRNLQQKLEATQVEHTRTKQQLAAAKARIRQYEQALDALFRYRNTIRSNETDETAMHD